MRISYVGEESGSWESEERSMSNRYLVMSVACCLKVKAARVHLGEVTRELVEGFTQSWAGGRNERAEDKCGLSCRELCPRDTEENRGRERTVRRLVWFALGGHDSSLKDKIHGL